jgi:hypothetical protein
LLEPSEYLAGAQDLDARRRQFEREREVVEAATDVR